MSGEPVVPSTSQRLAYLHLAIDEAIRGASAGEGGPFGAVVVKGDLVLAKAANGVIAGNDPTAHAEIQAIRAACAALASFQLDGCDLYASCEPCPMCLGAIFWARPRAVYYAATRFDAAAAGFDDEIFYRALTLPEVSPVRREQMVCDGATAPFQIYGRLAGRVRY